jgi:competence/damage-inducible protein CinA-like protein
LTASPRAVVVVTGSELVRGGRRDANGPFLAAELSRRGLDPARIEIVGDRVEELREALAEGIQADLCLVSGGLGPTHDDRTVETLGAVTGRALVVDPELEHEIEGVSRAVAKRLQRPYADFAAGVTKQASVPEGAVSLGLAGTAPALLLEHDPAVVVLLPGPPGELRRLWANAVGHPAMEAVLARAAPREHRVLRFFGPSESAVAQALDGAEGEGEGLEITVCAHDLEIHVDVFYGDEARERAEMLQQRLAEAFPEELFAVDDDRPVGELVLEQLRERGLRLATAESCTGGLVGAHLTDVPGSSRAYIGGVIAYSDEVKHGDLGVPAETLEEHGAVSAETAAAMAKGVRERFGADVAVAVTGIAGPDGGTAEKPVGLVYLHAQAPAGERSLRVVLPGDREAVRARATALALHTLRRLLVQPATHSRESDD